MARLTREEKTIAHAELIIDDMKQLYSVESEAYKEYKKLFEEYKKINKRFKKTVDISDTIGKSVIQDNQQLQDNVEYTVKVAKKKILHNIEEHRKTKETLSKHTESDKETIKNLKQEILELKILTKKLEKESNNPDKINHQFYNGSDQIVKANEINIGLYKEISYEILLNQKIDISKKVGNKLIIAKLSIDNFEQKKKELFQINHNVKKLISNLYQLFTTKIGSKNIVYYFTNNIFYFILENTDKNVAIDILTMISEPIKTSTFSLDFSIGFVEFNKENDDFTTINERCNRANEEASKQNNGKNIIFA